MCGGGDGDACTCVRHTDIWEGGTRVSSLAVNAALSAANTALHEASGQLDQDEPASG